MPTGYKEGSVEQPDGMSMASALQKIKRVFMPGIGQFRIYSPRPICLQSFPSDFQGGQHLPAMSIVVPSFNQGRYIEKTLKSIISQNYPNLELIVVDGGSTDNTVEIIEKYQSNIAWWVSEPDSGQVAAINKGFFNSSGEIMAWINSDDLVAPGALHFIGNYFLAYERTQVIYGNRILIDDEDMEIGRWVIPWHSDRVLRYVDFVPQETLYWRRDAWNEVGAKLDESFSFAMDWDFLLRLSTQRLNIEHVPFFLGLFRIHDQQKTSSQISIGQSEMQLIRRRSLGFLPTRNRLRWSIALFLMAAKLYELSFLMSK